MVPHRQSLEDGRSCEMRAWAHDSNERAPSLAGPEQEAPFVAAVSYWSEGALFVVRTSPEVGPGPLPRAGDCGCESRRLGIQTGNSSRAALFAARKAAVVAHPCVARLGTAWPCKRRRPRVQPGSRWRARRELPCSLRARQLLWRSRASRDLDVCGLQNGAPRIPAGSSWRVRRELSCSLRARQLWSPVRRDTGIPEACRTAERHAAHPCQIELEKSSRAALFAARKAAVVASSRLASGRGLGVLRKASPHVPAGSRWCNRRGLPCSLHARQLWCAPACRETGNCEASESVARVSQPDRAGEVVESCLVRCAQGSCGGASVRRETGNCQACGNVARASPSDRGGGVVESCLVRCAQGSCGGASVRRETGNCDACGKRRLRVPSRIEMAESSRAVLFAARKAAAVASSRRCQRPGAVWPTDTKPPQLDRAGGVVAIGDNSGPS